MILAAVAFGDPLMLAGLAAALVPVVLHLLNRMNAPVMAFPTLRFLKITAHKTARRRQIQQYFLLLVRVIVFALVAMAVAGPLIRGGNAVLAYAMVAMLLLGAGLLLVAGVWGTSAFGGKRAGVLPHGKGASEARAGAVAGRGETGGARRRGESRGGLGVLAMMAGMLALVLLGFGTYGLASDQFFARDAGRGGAFSGRSTALVIVLDNSHSMLVRDEGTTRLQRAKDLVRQLLGEAIRPAEAAIIATNPGPPLPGQEAPALTGDTTRLVGMLDRLKAEGTARPMRECVRMALAMLGDSAQPNKMLVIVGDFTRQAFADAEVFSGLKEIAWRKDLQVVFMPMGAREAAGANGGPLVQRVPADVGISAFRLAEGSVRPVVGAEMTFEAQIVNNGDEAVVRDVALTVDGNEGGPPGGTGGTATLPAAQAGGTVQRVQLGPAGSATGRKTIRIPYRLAEAGWHRFGVRLANDDAMPWDNQRELALHVADQIKVLVVGADGGAAPRVRSAAFYFAAALAPFGPSPAGGTAAPEGGIPWSIDPVYSGAEALTRDAGGLREFAAIYLCDLPRVSAAEADALARYVRGGGRIVWVLGPSVDSAAYNAVLLGANRGLLPLALGEPLVSATAAPLDWVDMHSGIFTNLFDSQDPFRTVLVTGRWSFAGDAREIGGGGAEDAKVLAKLPGDIPLLTQHAPAGSGGARGRAGAFIRC